jgi:hypothetical protein
MAMPMNSSGGPQWANPDPIRAEATVQENEFFAPLCKFKNVLITRVSVNFSNLFQLANLCTTWISCFVPTLATLDEPIKVTIMRDVLEVATKLKVVMLPLDKNVSCSVHYFILVSHFWRCRFLFMFLFLICIDSLWRILRSITVRRCRNLR